MKRNVLIAALITASAFFSTNASAQFEEPGQEETVYEAPKPETPKWISEKGFWIIKSNKQTKKESTIYFYNNEKLLVYQEEIKDRKLKLNKKTLMKLKSALEEAIDNYEKGIWASNNKDIVLQHLQR